jgi:hypothetical protein
MKVSDEILQRSVHSLAQSVLTPKEGYIQRDEERFHLQFTVRDGIGIWINQALTPELNGNGDGAGGDE